VWGAIGGELALDYFNWLSLAQPEPLPERLIGAETEFFVNWIIDQWAGDGAAISSEARAEYIRCLDENSIHAICEEYRAGATVDVAHDHEDRSRGVAIPCPVLCLWSTTGTGRQFDVLNEWRKLAGDVRGRPLDCGHFLPEERPAEVAEELVRFFGEPGRSHGP
jgi:haloacetate dehalogenase